MLRGNSQAKVDEKGRLKIPSTFKQALDKRYQNEYFVTSLSGHDARIYPLEEWTKIEDRFKENTFDELRNLVRFKVNLYGGEAEMDNQGRILIPQLLREKAGIKGDVFVLGMTNHLAVYNSDQAAPMVEQEFTPEQKDKIAQWGI
jgi:MraZ protein